MTEQPPLKSLSIAGFRSIRATTIDLGSPVTLLIGANGSGKSNLVGAFELLGWVVDGVLNDRLVRVGGLGEALYASTNPASGADAVTLEAFGESHDQVQNGYHAVISAGRGEQALVREETYFHDQRGDYDTPHVERLGIATESRLRERARSHVRDRYVLDVMSGCRVYHFDDVSPDAPPKKRADMANDLTLNPDAHNLAPLLSRIKESDGPRYNRIVGVIRSVAPFFDDFVLKPEYGHMLFRWRERGLEREFSADAMSDGTLRFVCLTALLLQPNPPATIVLDEPELGLHPFAIHQLAGLMRVAARHSRIIAATQSVTLLSQFSLGDVAIVERSMEGTVVDRPRVSQLEQWLNDYSLGEMWEKNLLGGSPKPDVLPVESGR